MTERRAPVEPAGPSEAALALAADGAMTVAAAIQFAGLSRRSLYRLLDRGEIAFVQAMPRKRLIARASLVAWLAGRMRGGAQQISGIQPE
jgi:excisionase family DNA binding protein